jgi:hypothetical protein
MGRVVAVLAAAWLCAGGASGAQDTEDEKALWAFEHAYWTYVQANDLASYRNLWHPNFVGWPQYSAAPVRKDHITDWITTRTSQGLAFKMGDLRPAAVQVTGDVAVTSYWVTYQWVDKEGRGAPLTSRIIHTLLREGAVWHIIGGMSMPEPAAPK